MNGLKLTVKNLNQRDFQCTRILLKRGAQGDATVRGHPSQILIRQEIKIKGLSRRCLKIIDQCKNHKIHRELMR